MEEKFKIFRVGEVRTRFAPSPTGKLHLGGARTALFNFLFARQNKGKFILRIEDTDVKRSKKEYEEDILNSLSWLGIKWDEGPDVGGPFAPYRQSERKEIYEKYLKKLIEEEKAYFCFCSPVELEKHRQYLLSIGLPPVYSGKCRDLEKDVVEKYLKENKKPIIRLKVPAQKIKFLDLIRGEIEFDASLIGDFALAKNFQEPLYNFVCAVDDFEMQISHVIRGEEHLSNTPKQILILQSLGIKDLPIYAHLPLILAPDRSKLSKRHGAVAVQDFREMGYLPEALINFLAFLGWNPGTKREFYSLSALIKDFSLERVKKGPAIFYIKRLDFLNGFYIREKSIEKLTQLCIPYLVKAGLIEPYFKEEQFPPAYGGIKIYQEYKISETKEEIPYSALEAIVALYQTRIKTLAEIAEKTKFFFIDKLSYPKEMLKWKDMKNEEIFLILDKLENLFFKIEKENWQRDYLFGILEKEIPNFIKEIKKDQRDKGYVLWPLRVALTGEKASAPPFEIAEILGKEKTIKRLKIAKEIIKNG